MRWLAALGVVVLAACSQPEAPWSEAPSLALDLKIEISAREVELLQPITVHLDLYRNREIEVEFAPAVDGADFLAETTLGPEVAFGAGFWQRTTMILRPVRGPGELTLPAFVARATDGTLAASTPEQTIVVTSSLAGHGRELEAPGVPFPSPPRYLLWGGGVLGLLLLCAAAWFFIRRRPVRDAAVAVALPPHARALRALQRLRSAPRATPAQIEAFYVEVSHVLRVYLEERFGLRAPERTTEEFLRDLEVGDALARGHRLELKQFLSQCDLVKFAAWRPSEDDHLATFAIAEAFVERTRPDRAVAAVDPVVEEVRA